MRPIVNLPEKNRVTDICDVYKKLDKDREFGSADILADRQRDTQIYSSQYFATAPVGEVKSVNI